MEQIIRNVAKCNACGNVIESKDRHNFVTCPCGNLSVDGGHDYVRRVYKSAGYTELSEWRTESEED